MSGLVILPIFTQSSESVYLKGLEKTKDLYYSQKSFNTLASRRYVAVPGEGYIFEAVNDQRLGDALTRAIARPLRSIGSERQQALKDSRINAYNEAEEELHAAFDASARHDISYTKIYDGEREFLSDAPFDEIVKAFHFARQGHTVRINRIPRNSNGQIFGMVADLPCKSWSSSFPEYLNNTLDEMLETLKTTRSDFETDYEVEVMHYDDVPVKGVVNNGKLRPQVASGRGLRPAGSR
jgi:hypothetical protein